MTAKLIALAVLLAALIPHRATAAGVTVHVQALVFVVLLAVAAAGLVYAGRRALAFRSSPYMRRGTRWSYA
jgi:hypothetical protein